MQTFRCPNCNLRFAETDRAWDHLIKYKRCPSCGSAHTTGTGTPEAERLGREGRREEGTRRLITSDAFGADIFSSARAETALDSRNRPKLFYAIAAYNLAMGAISVYFTVPYLLELAHVEILAVGLAFLATGALLLIDGRRARIACVALYIYQMIGTLLRLLLHGIDVGLLIKLAYFIWAIRYLWTRPFDLRYGLRGD